MPIVILRPGAVLLMTANGKKLDVEISEEVDRHLTVQGLNAEKIEILKEVLAQDPRPHYQKDPHKVYGMPYEGLDIHFTVCDHTLTVVK